MDAPLRQDPKAIGRTFRLGNNHYEIIGVAGRLHRRRARHSDRHLHAHDDALGISEPRWALFRHSCACSPAWREPVRDRLRATFRVFHEQSDNQTLKLAPAAAGFSDIQREYRRALLALAALVLLVLMIACANVANLMTAQAAARAREMALRVSIGAGRWRLVQLVLVESAMLAFLAAAMGGVFAWWSAPFVVSRISSPDNPVRLLLPADWRVFGFALILALGVTFLFGLAPALRASAVKPASALKGGDDPHSRRRLMYALVALQVAFCLVVHFVRVCLSRHSTGCPISPLAFR